MRISQLLMLPNVSLRAKQIIFLRITFQSFDFISIFKSIPIVT